MTQYKIKILKLLYNYLNKIRLRSGSLSRTIRKETIELYMEKSQIASSDIIKIKNISFIKEIIETMISQHSGKDICKIYLK